MNPSQNTVLTSSPTGLGIAKPDQFKRKYVATVYQGDTTVTLRFSDTLEYTAGSNLLTGSIVYKDSTTGKAVAGGAAGSAGNYPVPYLVTMGTDQKTVASQDGNTAGGVITAIPMTGYFRVTTTVYDKTKTYKPNDFLKATTGTVDGLTGVGYVTNAAVPYVDPIVGIVDKAVGADHFALDTLAFTAHFIPAAPGWAPTTTGDGTKVLADNGEYVDLFIPTTNGAGTLFLADDGTYKAAGA